MSDADALDRGGLVALIQLQPDLEVVGEAASVDETLRQCRALSPQVLLVTLGISGQDERPAIPTIRAEFPQLRILALADRAVTDCLVLNPPSRRRSSADQALSCFSGVDCLRLAVSQGAMATLRRNADPEELFRAIRSLAMGYAWYDSATAAALLDATRPGSNGPRLEVLSRRETEVAALIAEGASNKEIAASLAISEMTVKKHVGHIMAKLGLDNRLKVGLHFARNPMR